MGMILTSCGIDMDNMLIFGPYLAHIISVNLKERSTRFSVEISQILFREEAHFNLAVHELRLKMEHLCTKVTYHGKNNM